MEEMEELYVEGVATHGGPESCVVVCEGGVEALTGARAGQAIEPRNERIGVPTLSKRRKATLLGALHRRRRFGRGHHEAAAVFRDGRGLQRYR